MMMKRQVTEIDFDNYIRRLLDSAGADSRVCKNTVYSQIRAVCHMLHELFPLYMTAEKMQEIYNQFEYAGVVEYVEQRDDASINEPQQSVLQNNQSESKHDDVSGNQTNGTVVDGQPQSDGMGATV